MATARFKRAQRWYPGADAPAVHGIYLEIEDGVFMVLVGPSGCGKSTTLRMLAGLEKVNEGDIFIGDRQITHIAPKDRDIAMGIILPARESAVAALTSFPVTAASKCAAAELSQ